MTEEEIENIDIKVFEEKAVVMSAEDYTKLWAYVHQLQQENEELKKKVDQLQKQNEKALAIIDRLEFKK